MNQDVRIETEQSTERGKSMQPLVAIKEAIIFVAKAWTETDGNGGKASFSRLMGTVVIWNIVSLGYVVGRTIPPEWMTMFWVLIGYHTIARILSALSPAVLDIAKGFLIKAGATVTVPPVTEAKP